MKKRFLNFLILLVTLNLVLVGCRKKEAEDLVKEDYIPVEIEEISKKNLNKPRTFKGRVNSNEEVLVIPKLMGTVESVNIKLGDKVSMGQTLFTIDSSDIKRNLEQSKVAIDLARKGVSQAETVLNTAKINRTTTNENMLQSKLDYERAETLFKEGAIPKVQLEQSKLAFLSSDSQLKTVDSQIVQAEISLEQAHDQLTQAEISKTQVLDSLNDAAVTSPLTGVVSSLEVKLGQIVNNAQPAAIIVDNSKVYVEIQVMESVVNKLKQGQKVGLRVPAATEKEFASTIEYISPNADMQSKLYTVRAYVNNKDGLLRPGMTGEISLSTDEIKNTIAVPRDAILEEGDRSFVFVVEDNKSVKKEVTLGEDYDSFIEIKSGLKLGDKLITKGQHYVSDGKEVKVMEGE